MSFLPPKQSKSIHLNPYTHSAYERAFVRVQYELNEGGRFHTSKELYGCELGSKAHRSVAIKLLNSVVVKRACAILQYDLDVTFKRTEVIQKENKMYNTSMGQH